MLNWKHRYNKTVCSVSLVNKTNVKIKHQFAIILFFPCLHTVISSCTCAYNTYSYLEISADTLLAKVLKCVTQQQVKRSSLVTRTGWSGSSDWRSICCKVNALLLCCGNLLVDPRSWPHLWPWAVSWDLMMLQIEAAERSLFQGVLRLSPRERVYFSWEHSAIP